MQRSGPLVTPRSQIGIVAIIMLVALRFTIGWHFFNEGQKKLTEGFTSKHFLLAAKGPLADMYYNVIPDWDGSKRLDTEATIDAWDLYRDRINGHFGLDEAQQKKTQEIFDRYVGLLQGLRPTDDRKPASATQHDYRETYAEYQRELAWVEAATAADMQEVQFQEQHIVERQAKVAQLRAQLLAPLDQLWDEYEKEMNSSAVTTDEQYNAKGFYRLDRPGEHAGDLRFADWFIPRLHLIIGVLLMIGFLTRPAAIAAALFLLSVIVTQPYWLPNPISVQYQVVEFLAVLAVAAVGAGKWLGVDAFLVAAYRQWSAKRKGLSHEPNA